MPDRAASSFDLGIDILRPARQHVPNSLALDP